MKRFPALLLCFILIFSLSVSSFALESQDKLTPAPEITGFTTESDGRLSIDISHSVEIAEELRKAIYDIALEQYKSEEALLASPEKYLSYETKLYLELTTDNESKRMTRELGDDNMYITKEELCTFSDDGIIFVKIIILLF